jgi:hypothetical protein
MDIVVNSGVNLVTEVFLRILTVGGVGGDSGELLLRAGDDGELNNNNNYNNKMLNLYRAFICPKAL